MKSPFPGMDPFLERYWRDTHHALIGYSRDAIQRQLSPGLKARMEERVLLEDVPDKVRGFYPDVSVTEHPAWIPRPWAGDRTESGVAEAEGAHWYVVDMEPAAETYIEILDARSGGRVITVIEFLSPSNKLPGPDRDKYLRKMREFREGGVSTVEIDLLRKGGWAFEIFPSSVIAERRGIYGVCVRRPWDEGRFRYYDLWFHRRLSSIAIPLRHGEDEAKLDLQAMVDMAYENGAYGDTDYTQELDPPLTPKERQAVDDLLRAGGRAG